MSKSSLKVELITNGVKQMRKSDSMKSYVASVAQTVSDRCPGETITDTYYGKNEVNASVGSDFSNANDLLRAVGGMYI